MRNLELCILGPGSGRGLGFLTILQTEKRIFYNNVNINNLKLTVVSWSLSSRWGSVALHKVLTVHWAAPGVSLMILVLVMLEWAQLESLMT